MTKQEKAKLFDVLERIAKALEPQKKEYRKQFCMFCGGTGYRKDRITGKIDFSNSCTECHNGSIMIV